jgi:deazaflavin-dependent oxidoreductase (nitroreductase family)
MATEPVQKLQTSLPYPKLGWQKQAFRAPLVLWRMGLGFIIGKVIMVITTTGHKSKLPRHNMAEYYSLNGKKYTVCAYGKRAAWYKNIQADPRVTVQTAEGIESMRAVRVTDDRELIETIELFRQRNLLLTNRYLASLEIKPDYRDLLQKKDRLYLLRFDPTEEPTPPGLQTDLAWLWPALGGAILFLIWVRQQAD